jgi:hypothetical protein
MRGAFGMFRGTILVYSERRGAKRAREGECCGAAGERGLHGLAVKVKLRACGSPLELISISWDWVPSVSCQAVTV